MIVQCEECKTRFRMADDKVKPTGTKVRCSKCKHIFTVTLPKDPEVKPEVDTQPEVEPPSEPETQAGPQKDFSDSNEDLDYGDFNMERITEQELAENSVMSSRRADEQPSDDYLASASGSDLHDESDKKLLDKMPEEETAAEMPREPGFDGSFQETEKPSPQISVSDGSFLEDTDTETQATDDESTRPVSSESKTALSKVATEPAEDFSFDKPDDAQTQIFDERPSEEDRPKEKLENAEDSSFDADDGINEFPFEEDFAREESKETDWTESFEDDEPSFDFEEPQFEDESPLKLESENDGGLQFGEIDFTEEDGRDVTQDIVEDDDSSKVAPVPDIEPYPPRRESRENEEAPLPASQTKPKSPLARVLVLLVLLFLALGGAAGYFLMQGDGTFDVKQIVRQFPFLQPYLGQPETTVDAPRIGINISSTNYVNNRQAGQLLVIQGEAVNNYPSARSAITLKGVLLDEQNRTLLQQTVFCGNYLSEDQLRTMPFESIEETMNNQFGDSLSNMNVTAGKAIPFTIVFRNLPDEVANIHVEVVDSKPGQ